MKKVQRRKKFTEPTKKKGKGKRSIQLPSQRTKDQCESKTAIKELQTETESRKLSGGAADRRYSLLKTWSAVTKPMKQMLMTSTTVDEIFRKEDERILSWILVVSPEVLGGVSGGWAES